MVVRLVEEALERRGKNLTGARLCHGLFLGRYLG